MVTTKIKLPAYAGSFYPQEREKIKAQVKGFLAGAKSEKTNCLGCVLPHAGYIYSGKTACLTIAGINLPETIILLGPNHSGIGPEFSLLAASCWQTPLGQIEIDQQLSQKILKHCPWVKNESSAHEKEHSLEVELPLLQYFRPDFKLAALTIASNDMGRLKETGQEIAKIITDGNLLGNVLVIASSDLTHYEPLAQAQKKDQLAIEQILQLDEVGLAKNIEKYNISMCGYAPVITMLSCVKKLGAKSAKLVNYSTSADQTHDASSVVGYAGIKVY